MLPTQRPPAGHAVLSDESAATYYRRSLDVANHTGLCMIGRSPAHFRYWVNNPQSDEETKDLAFGRAFHCATLEPDVFAATYVVLPPGAPPVPTARQRAARAPSIESRRAIDWWDMFNAEHRGRTVITAADDDRVQGMGESIRNHSRAVAGLLVGGRREATLRWVDEETGLECKARLDNLEPSEFGLDLKKTRDASPEAFARSIASYQYDQQAAHYCAGARAVFSALKHFIFLACEDYPPYVCQPYFLDPMAEERGMNLRRRRMRVQAECLRTGVWPGYSQRIEQISLPSYAYYGIEEQQ